jgi:hypothetical protein
MLRRPERSYARIAGALSASTISAARPWSRTSASRTKRETAAPRPRPRARGSVTTPARKPQAGADQASAATADGGPAPYAPAQRRTPGRPGWAYDCGKCRSNSRAAARSASASSQDTPVAGPGRTVVSIHRNGPPAGTRPGIPRTSASTNAAGPKGRYAGPTSASTSCTRGSASSAGPATASRSRPDSAGLATATAAPARKTRTPGGRWRGPAPSAPESPCAAQTTCPSAPAEVTGRHPSARPPPARPPPTVKPMTEPPPSRR